MKERHYLIEDAKRFGILEAIVLYHIRFWIEKNRANGKHFYDGKYWTYNSAKAFSMLFEEISEHQMKRILSNLKDAGALVTGNYNKQKFDKTQWYSLGCAIMENGLSETQQPTDQNTIFDGAILHHGRGEFAQPIPDIKTDIKTDDDDNKQTDIYKTPTSSWEDIKKEKGIDLDLKEIAKEIIQDNAYLEYLAMDLGRLKVGVNIPLVKEYVNQAYLRLRIVNKIKHKDRSDGRNHIRNLILKDAKGSRELYDMAKREFINKQNKNDK